MPNYTSNYHLTKPIGTELYDIEVQNSNMDKIDEHLKTVLNVANYAESLSMANSTKIENLTNYGTRQFEASGVLVTHNNFEGMPLNCVTTIAPKQEGSGEPSPDNVRPISGGTSAKLTRCGKNLLEYTSMTVETTTINGVTYTVNSDGSITANGTATSTSILMLTSSDSNPKLRNALLGNQITMSGCPSGGGTNKYVIRLFQHAGENSRVDDAGSGVTTTFVNADLPFNVAIIVWSGVTVSNLVFRPMIRFAADTDASHKPYTDDTFAASFGQTVYGGTMDWTAGVLTVDRALKSFTGSEYWEKSSFTKADRFISPVTGALASSDVICSHGNGGGSIDDLNHCYITASSNFAWNYSAYGSTTVDELRAYLAAQDAAGTPVQVVYKLATPYTIQLAPNEILALAGMNNIWCNAGKTTVSGRTDILWLANDTQRKLANVNRNIMVTSTGTFSAGATIKLNDTLMNRNPVFIDMEHTVASGRVSGDVGSKVMSVSVVNSYNSGLAIKYVTFDVSDDGLTLKIKAIRNITLTSSGIAVSDSSSVSINGVRIITG